MAKRKKKVVKKKKVRVFRLKPAPLPSSFLLTAIVGLLISILWVLPLDLTWGVAFIIFFSLMFITSMYNMTRAPAVPKYQAK